MKDLQKDLHGPYQLTQDQLIREIQKADKVNNQFKEMVKKIHEFEDKSNSRDLAFFRDETKQIYEMILQDEGRYSE